MPSFFVQSRAEKVWGIPTSELRADWAAQRIKGLSLTQAVKNALFGTKGDAKSLIDEFQYPISGPGMMWERFQDAVDGHGGQVHLNTELVSLQRESARIKSIRVRHGEETIKIAGDQFISSMSLDQLIVRMEPPPPHEVLAAAKKLTYRDFIIVVLILNQEDLFPDNWIYIHSPAVKVGRIQNFKNWSDMMVPNLQMTSLGMEYFCSEGDEIWSKSDDELIALATVEIESLGLASASEVEDGTVLRQRKAYPVYDSEYRKHLDVIRHFLDTIDNLQTIGRNGMHRYNNQDHSMLTGMLAVRNLMGEDHDLWSVNTERSYYEEVAVSPSE